jgi:uncharacterized protein (UPF0332 family)
MKPEAQSLLQKARDSLAAAELLQYEGYLDFAASRTYYAMIYGAQALLLERGLSFSSHSAVIAAFGRELAMPGLLDVRLHRYLIDAQGFRNLGDYGIRPQLSEAQVEDVLRWAREFVTAAEQFLAGS